MNHIIVIVRKLPSVKTLGSASVICTDKTGTLATNEMAAVSLFLFEKMKKVNQLLSIQSPGFHIPQSDQLKESSLEKTFGAFGMLPLRILLQYQRFAMVQKLLEIIIAKLKMGKV